MSQIALLRPAWMQLAQPAYVFAIELQSGRTARMQSRMGIGKALQATRLSAQQAFHIFLDVVEIDLAHTRTPLLFNRRPPRSEERRAGKECVSTCRSRGDRDH